MRGAALLLVLAPAVAQAAPLPAAQVAAIDAAFADIGPAAPGCVAAVVRDGELVYGKGFGLQDVEQQTRLTTDSTFDLASTSKQFTAFAVVQLAEAGRLSLNDDIRKWLPEFPAYGRPIRIRHLLNHTSGIRDYSYLFFLKGYAEKDIFTDRQLLDLLTRQSALNFAPGSAYAYSNSGYVLLGEIVRRVTGSSLGAYAQAQIFAPLGMASAYFQDDLGRLSPHRARGYAVDAAGRVRREESHLETFGDGALIASMTDFLKWDRDFYAGTLWTPAIKREMLRPGVLTDGKPAGEAGEVYASGLELGARGGLKFITHAGSTPGFRSDFLRFPDQRVTIAAFCNFARARPMDRIVRIADVVLADAYRQPPETAAPAAAEAKAAPTALIPPDMAEAITGRYYNRDLNAIYTITVVSGRPVVTSDFRGEAFDFASFGEAPGLIGANAIGNENMRLTFGFAADGKTIARFTIKTSRVFGLVFEKQE